MCGHHRLPGATSGRRTAGGTVGDLRLRCFGAPGCAGGPGRGCDRPRDDPFACCASPGACPRSDLGATSAGDTFDRPPELLDSAVIFAPAGGIVPVALGALDRGGTLAIAGIYLSDIPVLNYADHLFYERQVRSVAAKTQRDGEEFLAICSRISIQVKTVPYRLEDADVALRDLAHDRVTGAAVLIVAAG